MSRDNILDLAAKAARQAPPIQPQGVAPQPSPMSIQIAQTKDGAGNSFVVLIVQHLYGQSVYHFEPDGADRIGDAMKGAARQARTGLEIPRM